MYFDKQAFTNDWISRFGDQRFCFSEEIVSSFRLPMEEAAFLIEMGLPKAIAPYLFFAAENNDHQTNKLTINYLPAYLPDHENHNAIVIGTDDAGSYVVLDPSLNYAVVLLEYDYSFRPVYINTSLWHMARCLLAYTDFIKKLSRENGEDAWEDYSCTAQQLADIRETLAEIDPVCVEKGFWKQELGTFKHFK